MAADRLIIILLSPALAFIVVLLGTDAFVMYFLAPYTQAYLLLIMILLRMSAMARTSSYKLPDQKPIVNTSLEMKLRFLPNRSIKVLLGSVNKRALKVLFFLLSFCLIEYVHISLGRQGFKGLTDLRMLFYSPFYGSIIVFVLYGIYLLMSNDSVRYFHISFTLKTITYFSVFFIGYWLLLYFEFAYELAGTNFKNANGMSYYSLFACFILLFRSDLLSVRRPNLYFLINLCVILLNTTRGAVMILALIIIYKYIFTKKIKWTTVLLVAVSSVFLTSIVILNIKVFLGESFFILADYVARADLDELSMAGNNYISSLGDARLGDDKSISSVSRIFVNYFALLNVISSPLIGVGQTESYMLDIFGTGIHSFQFMLFSSVGIVGTVVFMLLLKPLYIKHQSGHDTFVVHLFMFSVLIFTNTIPVYFSLLPFMTIILYSKKHMYGDRYV